MRQLITDIKMQVEALEGRPDAEFLIDGKKMLTVLKKVVDRFEEIERRVTDNLSFEKIDRMNEPVTDYKTRLVLNAVKRVDNTYAARLLNAFNPQWDVEEHIRKELAERILDELLGLDINEKPEDNCITKVRY